MIDYFSLLASELGEIRLKRNIDISKDVYNQMGGVVGAFYIATTTRELIRVVELCRELKIKFFIIGSGSKSALAKENLDILVIKNRSDNLKIFGVKGKVSRAGIGIEEAFIEAESGASLQNLAEFALVQKLTGLEDLKKGVGTVGGSFAINPTLRTEAHQVKVLTPEGEIETKTTAEVTREDIILSAIFKLKARKDGTSSIIKLI